MKHLSAYYFMSTDLCMNRAHIREDMQWLREHAFDAIHTACHEEHYRQPRGLNLIIEEAHAAGLKVYAIPSRWCGLIAGWPVLAGHFAASRPDTWMRQADGSPLIKNFCGPVCSIHHPDVVAHMIHKTGQMLETFDFDGITWDELKTLDYVDHHPEAIKRFGRPTTIDEQLLVNREPFSACNRAARTIKPGLRIISFIYAQLDERIVDGWSVTEGFDDIGPDGKVARTEDFNLAPPANKVLIEHTPKFLRAARAAGKTSFALIETQDLNAFQAQVALRRLPEFLGMGVQHLAVYYQPLVEEPEAQITEEVGDILAAWRVAASGTV